MGEVFLEEQYSEILEKCQNFKKEHIESDEKEFYIQIVHEKRGFAGSHITFDVYPITFFKWLMDHVTNGMMNNHKIPLFSYSYEITIDAESKEYKKVKEFGKDTDGWLKAVICDKNEMDCDLYGQLIWRCGEVECSQVGMKISGAVSESECKDIKRTTDEIDKNNAKIPNTREYAFPQKSSSKDISYDVHIYKVGNANTAYIQNNSSHESLLVDCGVDMKATTNYLQSVNEIKMFNPEYILISHNHQDHYNILFSNCAAQSVVFGLNNSSALKKIFMVDKANASFNLKLMKKQLGKSLEFVNSQVQNYENMIAQNNFPNIHVEFGNRSAVSSSGSAIQSSYENDTGIIVSILNKKNVVLTGDCSYDFIPASARLGDADYIVIPHHGGKVMLRKHINMKQSCVPIVSSGFKSLYSNNQPGYNPQYDQEIFLRNCGVRTPLEFLESIKDSCYKITDV